MGQKVHPYIQRIGIQKDWQSLWICKKSLYAKFLEEDWKIRAHIKKNFFQAAISKIVIYRLANLVRIKIYSARPGVIIGRHGQDIERLRQELEEITGRQISIDIAEIAQPFLEAQLVAENVAFQLERRVAFRRAMKRAIEQAISKGAKGIKIKCSGRLGGREMSRRESYKSGKIPLQTLRADIDYGFAEAKTTYGKIGVKVWLYKGDTSFKKEQENKTTRVQERERRRRRINNKNQ